MDCQETPEGYKVMYTPMAPGNYLIGVKYGGPNHIVGSPFKAKVTGKKLTSICSGPNVLCVTQQVYPSESAVSGDAWCPKTREAKRFSPLLLNPGVGASGRGCEWVSELAS